ncbi:MAG: hypothetical protein FWG50_03105 [Kiritimatiellaeota bacterium]|nr:hypothetical protein [Kiritimatiellota bacterium]
MVRQFLMASLAVAACCFGQAPEAKPEAAGDFAVNAKVTLADGSLLQGALRSPSLALATGFGMAEIPFAQIAALDFGKGGVTVKFRNRDVLSGKPEGAALELRTVFKDVRLDYAHVKAVQVLSDGNGARGAEAGLLLHAALDAEDEDLTPYGAHMQAKSARVTEGPDGNGALLLDSPAAAVTIDLPFSPYTMPEGTIEFWARLPEPHQRFTGSNGQPWFFNFECPEMNYTGHFIFGFTSNDGTGGGGLIVRQHGLAAAKTHASGAVPSVVSTGLLGDTPGGWHHYSVVWNREGLDFPGVTGRGIILMTVDGRVVGSGDSAYYGNRVDTRETEGKKVRCVIHGKNSEDTPLAMSDLKIWDHAKLPQ